MDSVFSAQNKEKYDITHKKIVLKISNEAQKVEVYLVSMSFQLDEKRKQLEETCHDEAQEKEVPSTGVVMLN